MLHLNDDKDNKQFAQMREKEAEALAQILSERYNLPYVDLSRVTVDNTAIRIISEEVAREAKAVIFAINQHKVDIAVQTPNNPKLASVLEEISRQGITPTMYIASEFGIARSWEIYNEVSYAKAETAGIISISNETMQRYVSTIKNIVDVKAVVESALTSGGAHSLSTVVEIVLGGAVATGVSDVHIEPEKEVVRIRYRLDGILQDIVEITHVDYKKILARIKLLAGVKLNLIHEAQDGRFTIKIEGIDVEVRTSILPAAYAESVVMRILNPESISVPLEELGMDEYFYQIMVDQINKPNGLILTTGPTGSGKTTTLYACLKKLRNPQIKIITIEDPIEYHLDGISQTQIDHDKGYDFSHGLRAAVRQDPDVILVGEIRDQDAAEMAFRAAMTGHQVYSTLHTNSAIGAIPRLLDLGVMPDIMAGNIIGIIAQRLVRKLCTRCKKPQAADPMAMQLLGISQDAGAPVPIIYHAVGCGHCSGTGYKGRTALMEILKFDADLDELITRRASGREIRKLAEDKGFRSLADDGIRRILSGDTSLDEIARVVDLTDRIQ